MILGILLFAFLVAIALMLRSDRVHRWRTAKLHEIHRTNVAEIARGDNGTCSLRYEWFNSVSYDALVFQFWRPLDSFHEPFEAWLQRRVAAPEEAARG